MKTRLSHFKAFKRFNYLTFYGKEIDYSKFYCPETERIYRTEVVALGKDFLMERENIDFILQAIRKIKDNIKF